jgi:hypothetical protein
MTQHTRNKDKASQSHEQPEGETDGCLPKVRVRGHVLVGSHGFRSISAGLYWLRIAVTRSGGTSSTAGRTGSACAQHWCTNLLEETKTEPAHFGRFPLLSPVTQHWTLAQSTSRIEVDPEMPVVDSDFEHYCLDMRLSSTSLSYRPLPVLEWLKGDLVLNQQRILLCIE